MKAVEKYSLSVEDLLWESERDEFEDLFEDKADFYLEKYPYTMLISHCCGCTPINGTEDQIERYTPRGDSYSKEFVSWWNGFPVELVDEDEELVYKVNWCDG